MKRSTNVVICEDHQIVADGLQSLITSFLDFRVAAVVGSYAALQDVLQKNLPEVLLLDLNLPDKNGIEILKTLFDKKLPLKVIVLTMYNKRSIVKKVVGLGAHGFLLKNCSSQDLQDALHHVISGGDFYYGEGVKKLQASALGAIESDGFYKKLQLTPRELEIIQYLCDGKKVPHIADSMFISPLTVETHKKNIYKKIGVNSAAKLVSFAHENRLL